MHGKVLRVRESTDHGLDGHPHFQVAIEAASCHQLQAAIGSLTVRENPLRLHREVPGSIIFMQSLGLRGNGCAWFGLQKAKTFLNTLSSTKFYNFPTHVDSEIYFIQSIQLECSHKSNF